MNKRKKLVLGILFFFLAILLVYLFQKQVVQIDIEKVKTDIQALGAWGPLAIILLILASLVFAPLAALPFWLISMALYGFKMTLLYILVANNFGAVINFGIARRWGRPLVVKFVGQKGTEKIDRMVQIIGLEVLVLGRIFSGAGGDFLSYAAGLTKMKFKPYFWITLFGTLPLTTLNVFLVYRALEINPYYLVTLAGIGYAFIIVFPMVIYRKKTKLGIT